ncbi:MAG TPA: S53 family peptidase [Caulobacteraceae bacterium]|jgi:kumamolisin|nr:S53 family peptidase [Caulobacteraceae bacterium]
MRPLEGSERAPMPGAKDVGAANPGERLEVSLLLRRRNAGAFADRATRLHRGGQDQAILSRSAYAQEFGAEPRDIAAVERFAQANDLAVASSDAATRTVVLSGTVMKFEAAFGVSLRRFEHADGVYRGRTGPVCLPPELEGAVQAVLGLDDRPQARPHFRIRQAGARAVRAGAAATSFTPLQLAQLYDFPDGTGAGQCIGIIELGGGFRPQDLKTWFGEVGVSPAPSVIAVSVDHAKNSPAGDPNSADGEVLLDIEVVGALAPQAKIAVYFAPNTDAGFLDALTAAVHDTVHSPSVISISWGGPESSWTSQAMTALDEALQSAAAMGLTVCVACGDNGSGDGQPGENVDFPASSPHALACGGTSIQANGEAIASEVVWDELAAGGGATGGGVSTVFATPAWQQDLTAARTTGGARALAFRGVPDVAGDADPQTGYQVLVDGQSMVIGGTSAVAPLWAGLIARINGATGKAAGLIQPSLYAAPAACRDITSGTNGAFAAAKGWDACTGLGSPDGAKLAKVLSLT